MKKWLRKLQASTLLYVLNHDAVNVAAHFQEVIFGRAYE